MSRSIRVLVCTEILIGTSSAGEKTAPASKEVGGGPLKIRRNNSEFVKSTGFPSQAVLGRVGFRRISVNVFPLAICCCGFCESQTKTM
jgi:hypothetical protein